MNLIPVHPADITAALKKAGSSQAKVARELGVSQPAVSSVIYGRKTSRRIAKRIARTTGLSLETLWPGRYSSKETKRGG